jgi:hypothetical protein
VKTLFGAAAPSPALTVQVVPRSPSTKPTAAKADMARALVVRARKARESIGDHGDPYEDALHTGTPSVELQLIIKEVFDHLRSALDYVAHLACDEHAKANDRIYFPIARRGFQEKDFKSLVARNLPGLTAHRPELLDVLASFQEFRSPANGWLPDFASLCNQSKHVRLTVVETTKGAGTMWRENETTMYSASKRDGSPLRTGHLVQLEGLHPADLARGKAEFHVVYVELSDINRELLTFLDDCVGGVAKIVDTIAAVI